MWFRSREEEEGKYSNYALGHYINGKKRLPTHADPDEFAEVIDPADRSLEPRPATNEAIVQAMPLQEDLDEPCSGIITDLITLAREPKSLSIETNHSLEPHPANDEILIRSASTIEEFCQRSGDSFTCPITAEGEPEPWEIEDGPSSELRPATNEVTSQTASAGQEICQPSGASFTRPGTVETEPEPSPSASMARTLSPPGGSFSSATGVGKNRRRTKPLPDLNLEQANDLEEKKRMRNTLAARKSRQKRVRQQEEAEEEIAKLKEELEHTKTELDNSKVRFRHTKIELYRTKADLNYTTTELDCMKAKLDDTKAELDHTKTALNRTKAELERYKTHEDRRGEPCGPLAPSATVPSFSCTRCHINFTTQSEHSRHCAVVHAENHPVANRNDRVENHRLREHGFKSIVNTDGVYKEVSISNHNGRKPSAGPAGFSPSATITLE